MDYLIDETDFGKACEIPELRKLKPEYQRFIWEWTHNGCDARRAASTIGYSPGAGLALLKRDDVIQAITALTDRMLHSAAIPAIVALEEIVRDPLHKDRLKASAMILNRTGWPEVTEHRVRVEKVPDEAEMVRAATDLAKKLGIDPAQLVGRAALQMIEASAVDITPLPAPLPDGSDI